MRKNPTKNIISFIVFALLLSSCAVSNIETKDENKTRPFPPTEDIKKELSDIKIDSIYPQGTNTLTIDFNLSDNLTPNFISIDAKKDVLRILRVIKEMNLGYESFKIRGISPLADEYGNTDEKVVIYLIYKRETIQKIKFDGMRAENVFKIADVKQVHSQME